MASLAKSLSLSSMFIQHFTAEAWRGKLLLLITQLGKCSHVNKSGFPFDFQCARAHSPSVCCSDVAFFMKVPWFMTIVSNVSLTTVIREHFDLGVGNMNINITVSYVNSHTKLRNTQLTHLTLYRNFREETRFSRKYMYASKKYRNKS